MSSQIPTFLEGPIPPFGRPRSVNPLPGGMEWGEGIDISTNGKRGNCTIFFDLRLLRRHGGLDDAFVRDRIAIPGEVHRLLRGQPGGFGLVALSLDSRPSQPAKRRIPIRGNGIRLIRQSKLEGWQPLISQGRGEEVILHPIDGFSDVTTIDQNSVIGLKRRKQGSRSKVPDWGEFRLTLGGSRSGPNVVKRWDERLILLSAGHTRH